ncbi:TNF receptor-associated factor 4-like [Ornithodoros turicata]|uniref:TNF receptor-associated factor 4-like n=1 Tax=Ornithodoros turicata TaxID=34597 RepID=UPI003138D94D
MSSASYLLGHFEALDWRPMQFANLPSAISCDLCAVIPENIFRLECYHSLCEGCYQGVLRVNQQCPLDKQGFLESEVVISPVRTTPLQKLEVHCCNFSHGCNFVGSLERMKSHFLKDCEFHALGCKKCCATVLRKDTVSHYMEEQCGAQNTFCSREDVAIDRSVVGIGRDISASLADIAEKLNAMEDQLNSHTVGIDTTKEYVVNYAGVLRTLQEEQSLSSVTMSKAVSGLRTVTEALSSIEDQRSNQVVSADDMKNRVISIGQTLTTIARLQKDVGDSVVSLAEGLKERSKKLETMLLSSGNGINVAFFHVQGVDELEKKAKEEPCARAFSNVFVLCGYSVRLCAKLEKDDSVMHISVYLYICRGPKDSLLKWPFLLPYTLILVHPTDDKKNIEYTIEVPNLFEEFPQCFNRPGESADMGYGAPKLCKLEDALNDGFLHENSITVGVTLVQSSQ